LAGIETWNKRKKTNFYADKIYVSITFSTMNGKVLGKIKICYMLSSRMDPSERPRVCRQKSCTLFKQPKSGEVIGVDY
jgi:hypothetical protein